MNIMNKTMQFSLEDTLGLTVEINKKHYDLIATVSDLAIILRRGIDGRTGLYSGLNIIEMLGFDNLMEQKWGSVPYYHSGNTMAVIGVKDLTYGFFKFALKNLSLWDKADDVHTPARRNLKITYSMIDVSKLDEKQLATIIKKAAKHAIKRAAPDYKEVRVSKVK